MRSRAVVLAVDARHGAARRPGRRPRRMVGEGVLRPGGRGGQRRSSPPSSRRPASRSRSSSIPSRSIRARSRRRSRPVGRPTSPSVCRLRTGFRNGRSTIGSWISRMPSGTFRDLFDPELLDRAMLLNTSTGQRALYALPMGRSTNHLHVWKSLLEQAGFTLEDIPKEWDAFWSFWCDEVQPAVRRATGRDDIWGVGLPMSIDGERHLMQFLQFMQAYDADYVTRDGTLVIDDPEIRRQAGQGYRQLHGDLSQGLHAARLRGVGRCRQQQGVPGPGGRHDAERNALDPQRAQARASR